MSSVVTSGTRGRGMLLLLFIFFAAPLLLVLLMHQYDWHPQGSSRGEMLAPHPLSLPPDLQNTSGAPVSKAIWDARWSMVLVSTDCAADCQQRLHQMRQLQVSLAKDVERVQRVLVASQAPVQVLLAQYPDLHIFHQPASAIAALQQQFVRGPGLYLVDPLGNVMMFYAPELPAADIRKDMTRLLRYAWAG